MTPRWHKWLVLFLFVASAGLAAAIWILGAPGGEDDFLMLDLRPLVLTELSAMFVGFAVFSTVLLKAHTKAWLAYPAALVGGFALALILAWTLFG